MRGARRPDGTRVTLLAGADHDTGAVVGQREIDAKTNEIPELRTQVAGMDLTGAVATADAAQCQKTTAEQIIAAGGLYLLTLKANQTNLLAAVTPLLAGTDTEWADRSHHSVERGHGRTEHRTVRHLCRAKLDAPAVSWGFVWLLHDRLMMVRCSRRRHDPPAARRPGRAATALAALYSIPILGRKFLGRSIIIDGY